MSYIKYPLLTQYFQNTNWQFQPCSCFTQGISRTGCKSKGNSLLRSNNWRVLPLKCINRNSSSVSLLVLSKAPTFYLRSDTIYLIKSNTLNSVKHASGYTNFGLSPSDLVDRVLKKYNV